MGGRPRRCLRRASCARREALPAPPQTLAAGRPRRTSLPFPPLPPPTLGCAVGGRPGELWLPSRWAGGWLSLGWAAHLPGGTGRGVGTSSALINSRQALRAACRGEGGGGSATPRQPPALTTQIAGLAVEGAGRTGEEKREEKAAPGGGGSPGTGLGDFPIPRGSLPPSLLARPVASSPTLASPGFPSRSSAAAAELVWPAWHPRPRVKQAAQARSQNSAPSESTATSQGGSLVTAWGAISQN